MTYPEIVTLLVKERAARGLSGSELARRLGTSPQRVSHWEAQRNRADIEDLARWAGLLGHQLVIDLTESKRGALAVEIGSIASRLDDDQVTLLARVGRLLDRLDRRDYQMLLGMVEVFEENARREDETQGSRSIG